MSSGGKGTVERGVRILVVSQFFWPEEFRVNELTAELTRRGHTVTVLTGKPNYPGGRTFPEYAADPARYGRFGEARVVRVPVVARGRSRFRLVLNYVSFAVSAASAGVLKLRREPFDVVFVFQPSPVTAALPGLALGRIKRAPVVLWVLDQWPETLIAVGAVTSPVAIGAIERLVAFIYRRCRLVLTPSRSLLPVVRRHCFDDARVAYFPNWVEGVYDAGLADRAPEVPPRRDAFTLMFAGNIGEAQDFPTILDAAERLRSRADIRWLIVGDGRKREWLEGEIGRRGLADRFVLLGRQRAHRMPSFFSHADAVLVSLKKDAVFSLTVPGKLQTYLAVGKPVIGVLDGEGAETIRRARAGVVCSAADSAALAEIIVEMSESTPAKRAAMGENGKEYARREYDRDALLGRLEGWLTRTAHGARGDGLHARFAERP